MTTRSRPRLALLGVLGAGLLVLLAPALPAQAQGAPNEQDRAFLVGAHQSNLAEIAAGEAALAQATTEFVRQHGQLLITDHTRLDGDAAPVAAALGVPLPPTPTPEQQASLDAVKAQPGSAFDAAWITQQITSHRQTLALGEAELAGGQNAEVKALAAAAAPVVQSHLDMLLEQAGPSGVQGGYGPADDGDANALGVGWLVAAGLLIAGAVVAVRWRHDSHVRSAA